NSDDPPMFNTTLTDEYLRVAETFHFDAERIEQFVLDAARASLLPESPRAAMEESLQQEMAELRARILATQGEPNGQ
ncbi:MAG: hypothetical protein ACREEM_44670, partial [Blastocatellia bacterium]